MSNGWGNQGGGGWGNQPQQGWGQQPQQQQQQQQGPQRKVVARWTAYENNEKPGSTVECELVEIPTQKGGKFTVAEFYKPYESKKPEDIANGKQWKKSYGIAFPNGIRQLIDRVNWLIARYGTEKGMYVFMPAQVAPQMGYGQPQQYGPPAPPQGQWWGPPQGPAVPGTLPPPGQWGPPPSPPQQQQPAPQQNAPEAQQQPQQAGPQVGWNAPGPKW